MYENYYGFAEKPFSPTPDPKYLYRNQSHANAFDLLQYAIERREGFVVVTGDIGTGKRTLCRALLEQIDRTTFIALVLNPFLTEEDLLRGFCRASASSRATTSRAGALPASPSRNSSTRCTSADRCERRADHRRGAESAAAGSRADSNSVEPRDRQGEAAADHSRRSAQPAHAAALARFAAARSTRLDSIRARPARSRERCAYVAHRLAIAGGNASVSFAAKALDEVHRLSGGIPRLINLICDRTLLGGMSVRT